MSKRYKAELDEEKPEAELVNNWNVVVRNLWYKNSMFITNFLRSVQSLAIMKDRGQFTGFQQNDSQISDSFRNVS